MKRFLPLLFLLPACIQVRYENPEIPPYNVWLVLNNPLDTQYLFFDRVYSPEEEASYGMDGARAWVWNSADTFGFDFGIEIDTLTYYYAPFVPFTGDTYSLMLITPDSLDTLRATTVVPGDFAIVQPESGDTVEVGEGAPLIVWTSSDGAVIYKLKARNLAYGFTTFFSYYSADTVSDMLRYSTYFPVEGYYDIYVIGYNRDMYDYAMSSSNDVVNIDGAAGVFGAVVERKVRLYIRVSSR